GDLAKSGAEAVAIDSSGRIVVIGTAEVSSGANEDEFAIARYLPNGKLDNSFDGDGKRTLDVGNFDSFNAGHDVAIQADGKIVVVGMTYRVPDEDFAILRFRPNGALDGSTQFNPVKGAFDGDGKKFIGFGNDDEARAIAIDTDGTMYIAGNTNVRSNLIQKIGLVRLGATGGQDSSFDGDGKLTFAVPGRDKTSVTGVMIQGSKVVISGFAPGGDAKNDFLIARFNHDGTIDKTFGGKGKGFRLIDMGSDDVSGGIVRAPLGNGNGFFVSGKSSGLALAKFTAEGLDDKTFGNSGRVRLGFGGVARVAVLGKRLVLAGGTQFSSARIIDTGARVVSVGSVDSNATEGGSDGASLIVARTERLPFASRVFFKEDGIASNISDYSDGFTHTPGGAIFVDIPANQTFTTVPITTRDDLQLEAAESATFAILSHPTYEVGTPATANIDFADNDEVHINFQAAGAVPASYRADTGQVFGNRGNGYIYGWDADNTANARNRNSSSSPDARFDGFNHMQKNGANRRWELAVANGVYEVTTVAGDPVGTDSVYAMNLEGSPGVNGTPANLFRWVRRTVNVQVSDGRLTLSNAAGSVNNKIAFLDIKAALPGVRPGPVTNNFRVLIRDLPVLQPVIFGRSAASSRVFSQISI
ncbi:MAG TPA: delta-60 repeat domain-containing protein, partial [Tepidisphaeraceae bacterium]